MELQRDTEIQRDLEIQREMERWRYTKRDTMDLRDVWVVELARPGVRMGWKEETRKTPVFLS